MVKEKGSRAKAVLRVHSRCKRGSRLTKSRLSEAESPPNQSLSSEVCWIRPNTQATTENIPKV